jgi:large repetitive protein
MKRRIGVHLFGAIASSACARLGFLAILLLGIGLFTLTPSAAAAISYVQGNYATPQSSQAAVSITFASAQTAGDLNVVVVGWNDSTAAVNSVTDSLGNVYTRAVGPTAISGVASQSIYYSAGIKPATAGANIVTVAFSTPALYADIRILEYSGISTTVSVDVTASATGSSGTNNSGSATTTNASDLIFGGNLVTGVTTGPGAGFTQRILTSPDGDIAEDKLVTATGSYSATAPASGAWIMQMVAFEAAGSGTGVAPAITSASSTAFVVGTAGSFTVTTTGTPTPSLSETGTLPGGVTFTNNGNGTATIAGTPAAGSAASYPLTITATNGVGTAATQSFTLTVNQVPAITSASSTTFTVGTVGSFTVTTTGSPKPSLSESGALPSGVTFTNNGNGTATLGGTPATGTNGTYPLTITATNGIGTAATQSFTLTVSLSGQAPAITSASSTTFTVGTAGTFTVTTTGTPAPTLSDSGTLPSGVTFTNNGNGTATLGGTPATGTNGTYPLTITATNGVGTAATQSFALTVNPANQAPAITSAAATTFIVGGAGSFTVTTTGTPTPSLSDSGTLPSGVTFTNNGNGTATLSGTPAAGTAGSYPLTITATNGVGTAATQSFTLNVTAPAVIAYVQGNYATPQSSTKSVTVTFTAAQGAGDLNVVVVGWNDSTAVVSSVTDSSGNAYTRALGPTALSGVASESIYYSAGIKSAGAGANIVTVAYATAAAYPDIRILEYSGVSTSAPVDVTSAATGTSGTNNSGSVTTTNASDLIFGANLVTGITTGPGGGFTQRLLTSPDGDIAEDKLVTVTGSYSATAAASGQWIMQMVAFRAAGTGGTGVAPAITSASSTTFVVGTAGSFTVTTTGTPTPSITATGALPSGVTFKNNGNGTATLSGTPATGTGGSYPLTITATNGVGTAATQSFTLTVSQATQAPAITSANNTTFTVGGAGTFTVTTTGTPTPSLSESGSLPSGVTFVNNGNGTATLSGTPASGTNGTYALTITATNGVGTAATQSFTLTVQLDTQPPTTPTNLTATAVSGSQINLSWTASTDNVGVTGYLIERCAGVGCNTFARVLTVPGTTYSDTGLTTNTSYTYQVKATDAAGNFSPYSNQATATTLTTIAGLVAAYSFDEGTGTTANDLSGNGNTGTVVNATWTSAAKYGNALVFNGTNSMVTIPNSASLQLTSAMTLEAWVNPAVVANRWTDVIYKNADNYYLEGTSNQAEVPGGGNTVGSTDNTILGTTPLAPNAWTHLALTYDGTTLRLYVNGVQISSLATSGGPMVTSTNPLQIGGDAFQTQYFQGTIDEVRVYNAVLNQTQIQSDMNTPVSSGSALPLVSFGSSSLSFGNQSTGSSSAAQPVTLTNAGESSLSIGNIAIAGGNASDFTQTNNCPSSVAPNGSCTINVTFSPLTTGPLNSFVQVTDNAPGSPQSVALSGTGTGFVVTPRVSVLTFTGHQQFSAGGGTITWSVDGLAGGSSSTGTITSGGLYSPPSAVGTHTVTATTSTQSASATVYISNFAGAYTFHNDAMRSGQNLNEIALTLSNVNDAQFGKLFSYSVDGLTFASPLYVASVNIPGQGFHNVVYVSTEHDSVYAFDADGLTTTPLWHRTFLGTGVTTVPCNSLCGDIPTEYGVTGTPVIDPTTNTLYVVAATQEGTNYVQRLHALDITTGADKFGGPVVIQASMSASGAGSQGGVLAFDPFQENQRPALLLSSGVVYLSWGSHEDSAPWHGWIMGYNATTLQQTMVYCSTPDGLDGGFWASGGPGTDSTGDLYFTTGNGDFNVNTGGRDYGDSLVKVGTTGSVVDYFTPHNQAAMESGNLDFSSSGPVLLVDQPGTYPHLLVAASKTGTIFVINRDNLGHYNPNNDNQVVQNLVSILPNGTEETGNYSAPAYFNGYVYFAAVNDDLKAFQLTNGLLSSGPTSQSPELYPNRGGSFSVSANGSSNGIIWAVQDNSPSNGILYAYNAGNLSNELYNSNQVASRDSLGVALKMDPPLVANGKVFVLANGQVVVYGLLP